MRTCSAYPRIILGFVIREFSIFVMQSLIFFMLLVFSSHFFQNDATLDRIVDGKFNDYIYSDFFYSVFAIIFVAGLVSLTLKIIGSGSRYYGNLNVVLHEIPKVFYLVGNSVGTAAIAISLEPVNKEGFNPEWFGEGVMIFFGYFLAGLLFAFLLRRHELMCRNTGDCP